MRVHQLLPLLYASIFAIIFLLALLVGYTLSGEVHHAEIPLVCGTPEPGRNAAYTAGKKLWNMNGCGACHNKSMKDEATGPALGGVTERWADYPQADLRSWIRNSQALLATNHPRARKVWSDWKPTVMPVYTNLTDDDIDALLAYIEDQYASY